MECGFYTEKTRFDEYFYGDDNFSSGVYGHLPFGGASPSENSRSS